jgi:hypothetical protein
MRAVFYVKKYYAGVAAARSARDAATETRLSTSIFNRKCLETAVYIGVFASARVTTFSAQ